MNEEGFKRYFRSERMPNWACPEWGSRSLTLVDDTFNAKYKTPIDTSHAEFDPDWIEYVFTMHLECSVGSCKHRVVCIGDGSVSQEYTHDGEGSWDWFEQYQVKRSKHCRLFNLLTFQMQQTYNIEALWRHFAARIEQRNIAVSRSKTCLT